MDETEASEIEIFLGSTRHGRVLPQAVVEVLKTYFEEVVVIKDVSEVEIEELHVWAEDAWADAKKGAVWPRRFEAVVKAWAMGSSSKKVLSTPSSAKTSRRLSVQVEKVKADDVDEEDTLLLFGRIDPPARDTLLLQSDMEKQGLTGERVVCLSAGIELGTPVSMSELQGETFYKSDARVCKMARERKKAGVPTLAKILEGKTKDVRAQLQSHFSHLIRDLTDASLGRSD